jgi:hypothetical protein
LAFDGTNYLVVWVDARHHAPISQPPFDLYGTRISPAGAPLDGPAATGGIAIRTADVSPNVLDHPVAVFDGANYLVGFAVVGSSAHAGIHLARVSAGGALLDGPPGQLGPSISGPFAYATRAVYPAILPGGVNVLVTWVDNSEQSGTTKSIVGAIVSPPLAGGVQ